MCANSRKMLFESMERLIEWYGVDSVLAAILDGMPTEELGRLVIWLYDEFDICGDNEEETFYN